MQSGCWNRLKYTRIARITRRNNGPQMKFLAVHPTCLMYSKIYLRLEPLGLELVAAAARRAGHTVRLLICNVNRSRIFFGCSKAGDLMSSRFRLITSPTFQKSSISLELRAPYCLKHLSVLVDTVFRLSLNKFYGMPAALWIAF